jgi:cytochrome bd-type quinol oxidase subunit 2
MSILLSFIPTLIMIALVVAIVRKVSSRSKSLDSNAQPVRLFFQYSLVFGLFIIVTVGIAGLLGRVLDTSNIVNSDQSSLASNLAFVVVGGPLLAGLSIWLRNSLRENPSEGHGFVPTFFATLAAIISLLVFLTSIIAVIHNVMNNDPALGSTISRSIVWGTAWIIVLKISNSVIPKNDFRIQYFVGSFITALAALIGLVQVLTGIFASILSQPVFLGTQQTELVPADSPIVVGLGTLLIAGGLWVYYWIKNANTIKTDSLWLGYVLIAGVGATLVTAIVSLSVSLYQVLVWNLGEPATQKIADHFAGIPQSAAVASAGLLFWWYHRSLLPIQSIRTDIQRTYEYLMSAISLIASAVGISIVIVAIIEALTEQNRLSGPGAINTLIGAATVIIVAGPVWWRFWSRIQRIAKSEPESEHGSPVRRTYLFLLFGVGGITAIISLITIVFQLFDGILSSNLGANTFSDMRFAIGILISTGIVAGYHWEIYRHEKDVEVSFAATVTNVLLVGPKNPDLIHDLKAATNAKVSFLQRTDADDLVWPTERVIELVAQSKDRDLLILLEATGVKVVPVNR